MKIELEDKDIAKIASAVVAALPKAADAAKGKSKTAAKADEDETGEDAGDETGEDAGGDEGGDEASFEGEDSETEAKGPSKDDVLEALKAVTKKHDQETAMDVLRKAGKVSALSKLKPENFAAVIKACKAKAAK